MDITAMLTFNDRFIKRVADIPPDEEIRLGPPGTDGDDALPFAVVLPDAFDNPLTVEEAIRTRFMGKITEAFAEMLDELLDRMETLQ